MYAMTALTRSKNSHYLLEQQAQKSILNDELQKLQGLITSMEKESERRQAVDTELRDLIARSGRSEEVFNRKVALLQKENEDLIARLSTIESEQSMLSQQVINDVSFTRLIITYLGS